MPAQGQMPGREGLEAHTIHASLHRPVLFAGAEPSVVVLEATTALALLLGIGIHVATVVLAVFYATAVHGVMVWVANQDAHMIALYVRSLSARDFYPAHGGVHAPPSPVHPSIPPQRG